MAPGVRTVRHMSGGGVAYAYRLRFFCSWPYCGPMAGALFSTAQADDLVTQHIYILNSVVFEISGVPAGFGSVHPGNLMTLSSSRGCAMAAAGGHAYGPLCVHDGLIMNEKGCHATRASRSGGALDASLLVVSEADVVVTSPPRATRAVSSLCLMSWTEAASGVPRGGSPADPQLRVLVCMHGRGTVREERGFHTLRTVPRDFGTHAADPSRRNLTLVVVGRFAPFGSSVRLLTRAVGDWTLRSGGDRRVHGVVFPDGKVPLAR